MGYPKEINGYYFYHPQKQKVFVAKHVVFPENEFLDVVASGRNVKLNEIQGEPQTNTPLQEPGEDQTQDVVSIPQPSTQEPHRSMRVHREQKRYGFLISAHGDVLLAENDKPTTYDEAMSDIDSGLWQMDDKIAFLKGNLVEDVYMTQSDGFVTHKHANKIYKLQRSVYRLKQVSWS